MPDDSAAVPQSPSTTASGPRPANGFEGAAVSIQSVSKSFGKVKAVDNVSLDVSAGEFIALLGPSGSGKTTLFMTIAGFETAEQGRVVVGGREVTRAPAYDRGFGMVFQRYALFPHMNVAENVAYPLKMRRVPAAERRRQVSDVLELLDLDTMAHRRPDQISGGQQQRVALARALVFRPPVLLMDEPLAALDRKLREQVQLEIRRLHRELGTTILYVTHDQEEAMVLADRVCVMRDGHLLQVGTPAHLYDQPDDAFVAGFLGRTNFVPATLVDVTGSTAHVEAGGRRHRCTVPQGSPLARDSTRPVQLAIRPEQVTVTPVADVDAAHDQLAGRVTEIIFTGATTTVRADVGFTHIEAAMVTDERSRRLAEGDPVAVAWSPDQARVYPGTDD